MMKKSKSLILFWAILIILNVTLRAEAKRDVFIRGLAEPNSSLLTSIKQDERLILAPRGPGFFSEFLGALNWLKWAEKNSVFLKILWDRKFLYGQSEKNHWIDFFEPFWDEALFNNVETTIIRSFLPRRSSPVLFPPNEGTDKLWLRRASGCRLVEKYIRVKADIAADVESFCKTFFSEKHVIAIHLRSLEKNGEGKQVPASCLIELANQIRKENTVFFVLTDSEFFLNYAKKNLEGPVVATDCLRVASKNEGVHKKHGGNLRIAREALVDVLIAAQSDVFLFTTSSLAFSVLLFNPKLRGMSLQGIGKRKFCYPYLDNTDEKIAPKPLEEAKELLL